MAKKESILVKAAEEMNRVMAYGMDEKGKVVEPDEQIDTTLKEKALEKELEARCKEDLRMEDKEDFSEEVWALFEEKGWGPLAKAEEPEEEEEDAEEPEEGEDAEAPEEEEEDDEEEEKPAKKSKKEKAPKKSKKEEPEDEEEEEAPKPKKSKRDDGTKKSRAPRDKGPSFEQIAMDIVKSTDPKDAHDALMEKFTELYHERGKTDADFIKARVNIYHKIACTRLHIEMVGVPVSKKEKAPKKSKKEEKAEKPAKKSKRD